MSNSRRGTGVFLGSDVRQDIAEAAERLGTSQAELLRRAVQMYIPTVWATPLQDHLGPFPTLPHGYHRSAARIYRALIDLDGGPVGSQKLADYVQLHRGNVDRHLTRLRSDGYVERTAQGHRIVTMAEQHHIKDGPHSAG